ncbi:MAG: hypothetical protein JRG97_03110 [Deltaproteobacteria bacterium]|nr:hypothetical protein [Deltaproteobacteria bacterium]
MPLQRQRSGAQNRYSMSEAVFMSSAKGRSFAEVSTYKSHVQDKRSQTNMTEEMIFIPSGEINLEAGLGRGEPNRGAVVAPLILILNTVDQCMIM